MGLRGFVCGVAVALVVPQAWGPAVALFDECAVSHQEAEQYVTPTTYVGPEWLKVPVGGGVIKTRMVTVCDKGRVGVLADAVTGFVLGIAGLKESPQDKPQP